MWIWCCSTAYHTLERSKIKEKISRLECECRVSRWELGGIESDVIQRSYRTGTSRSIMFN
jgi:hypothetical protein